jgi:superfamily II DNA or RNA helicase
MGLTATHDITDKNDKAEYYTKYCPIVYEYYESADDGLINKTRFFVVNHILSDHDEVLITSKKGSFLRGEAEQYVYLSDRIKKGQQMMLMQGSQSWFTDAADWFWKGRGDKEQKFAAMMYLNSIKYRKEFLQKLNSTANIAKKVKEGILAANEKSKVLIFSELTAQIEKITSKTVHSHNNATMNASRIDHFDIGDIRELGSCQSLTLGLNLIGATHGIMESYVGSETRSKQKKGRLDRLATDQIADMWIIRVVDTQGEKWFENMVKGFDLSKAVHIDSGLIMRNGFDYGTNTVK